MVGVAQLAEHQVVALGVVGSSPITHPIDKNRPLSDLRRNGLIVCAYAPVAQMDRAPDFESVGRPFESGRAYHQNLGGLAALMLLPPFFMV